MTNPFNPAVLVYRAPKHLALLVEVDDLYHTNAGIFLPNGPECRSLHRYAPTFVDDPSNSGLFPHFGGDTYVSSPVFVTAMAEAALVGYRTVIKDDWFTMDEWFCRPEYERSMLDNLAQPDAFLSEDTGFVPMGSGTEKFLFDSTTISRRRFDGTTLFIGSHEPSNYGSLLFRVLTKMATVRALGLQYDRVMFWSSNPSFAALAELAGIPSSSIVSHQPGVLTECERVLMPSLRNPHAFLDPESRALMLTIADRYRREGTPKRIYISRSAHAERGGNTRVCLNERELEGRLAAEGFAIIDLESYSNADQIALFAGADMIVGPSGSGMFNCVFSRPGTRLVDIESEPNWIYAHMGLFASCGLRYGIITGDVDVDDPRPVHRSWRVDVDAVVSRACTDW